MRADEFSDKLRGAAERLDLDDEVPGDRIAARGHRIRRNRLLARSSVIAMIVVAGVVGVATPLGRRTDQVHVVASQTVLGDDLAQPQTSTSTPMVPMANPTTTAPGTPVAEHYFKATARLDLITTRSTATPEDWAATTRRATTLLDDKSFIAAVATRVHRSTTWVAHRFDITNPDATGPIDVTAIGTDPQTTARLADAVAKELADRINAERVADHTAPVTVRLVIASPPRSIEINQLGFDNRFAANTQRFQRSTTP